ncbi:lytic transglycosylase domain-containing protein [Pseudomaricurvus sp. HS19]|uniref:lytic transglycosylase domain-containing protein n=1 Tax=Pseudomaricurvus sp. HS19 TaxID=2692626 RepID=UPI00136AC438|nr:transglycosylase SLT domain-containing protein [Pseudomaricurvus sp. HS19]
MKTPRTTVTRLIGSLLLLGSLQLPMLAWGNTTPDDIDPELRAALKHAIESSDSFVDRYDAEVWLVSKQEPLSRFIKDHEERMDLLRRIHRAALQADLQPEIVLALIEVESHFNRFAVSSVGAQGMMQVMPFWKDEIGHPEDNLTDVDTNLRYGCAILKHYLERTEGRLIDALARYNGSYGKYWYPERVMTAWEKHWR